MPKKSPLKKASEEFNLNKIRELLKSGTEPEGLFSDVMKRGAKAQRYWAIALIYNAQEDLEAYEKTGVIGDKLLPFFDQDGKWMGLLHAAGTFGRLEKEEVPKERLSHYNKTLGGEILLSSYVLKQKKTDKSNTNNVELPYLEIHGCVNAHESQEFKAGSLQKVLGPLILNYTEKFNAPKLQFVGGNFLLRKTREFHCPELSFVGGALYTDSATKTHIPKLLEVGSRLEMPRQSITRLKTKQLQSLSRITQDKETQEILEKELSSRAKAKLIAETQKDVIL